MNTKEKAEELVLKYLRIDNNTKEWFNIHIAKQCALIAVGEILKSVPKQPSISITMPHFEATVYWEEVKTILENEY